MKTAERATARVERGTALDEVGVQAHAIELLGAPGAGEEAAGVLEPFRLDDEGAAQFGFGEDHLSRTP